MDLLLESMELQILVVVEQVLMGKMDLILAEAPVVMVDLVSLSLHTQQPIIQ
jgi:hypothetical protein